MARSVVGRARRRRWALVVVVAAVLLAVSAVVAALPTPVDPVEPGRLRELMMRSEEVPHQGYAESNAMLGVPDLPNLAEVTSLLNGRTRIRSWYDSPSRWRFDVLSVAGERDVYRTPSGELVWDYGANLLIALAGEAPVRLPRAGDLLPPDLARLVLKAAPDDPISGLPSRRVAGMAAAGLRLRPADQDTTVGHVDIWADPASGLPVQVEVTARGANRPILVTRFLELTLSRPAADTLEATPAPDSGYTVTTAPDIVDALGFLGQMTPPGRLAGRALRTAEPAGVRGVGLYGTGLSAFVAMPLPREVGASATDAARKAGAIDVTLPGGTGVLLEIPPLSVIIERSAVARRWYLLAGLVDPALLERAAAELSTLPRSDR